jgi:hypothetical protein
MSPLFVEGVGVLGPGIGGWEGARALLDGSQPYAPGPLPAVTLDMLPAVERRRTSTTIRLALSVAREAMSGRANGVDLSTIFCSSGGDGEVIHEICETLAGTEHEISPTRFHNSVHNAPAGYWGIATRSSAPSTSLASFDWTFAAGMLEAAVQIATEFSHVLLVCFDAPYPEPLHRARPVSQPFACALLLRREPQGGGIRLSLELAEGAEVSRMPEPQLETLRQDNPAARSLPLLAALAQRRGERVVLDYVAGRQLSVEVAPC